MSSLHYNAKPQTISMEGVTINKVKTLERAEKLLSLSSQTTSQRKQNQTQKSSILNTINIHEVAPTIHIEHEISILLQAAIAFRICGKWMDASEVYSRAAWMEGNELSVARNCKTASGSNNDNGGSKGGGGGNEEDNEEAEAAAALYMEAALCAEKVEIGFGEEYFRHAISHYCKCSEYSQAGRISQLIATNYYKNKQYDQSQKEYEMTAKYYKAAQRNKNRVEDMRIIHCERQRAMILGLELRLYSEASDVFSIVGRMELEHNLMKYNAKESFFKSILLYLLSTIITADDDADTLLVETKRNDDEEKETPSSSSSSSFGKTFVTQKKTRRVLLEKVKKQIKEYEQIDLHFESSAECDFLYNIIKILWDMNMRTSIALEDFADHLYDLDSVVSFDELSLFVLEQIMEMISSSSESKKKEKS